MVLSGLFLETTYVCVHTYQFHVYSLILTSFRQGRNHPPIPKQSPKHPIQIWVKKILILMEDKINITLVID